MDKLPFTSYDFFGYLISGFITITAIDYGMDGGWLLTKNLGVVHGLFWVVVSYVVGQLVAGMASWLYTGLLVGRWLGQPDRNLFSEPNAGLRNKLFSSYMQPMPPSVRERILTKAESYGVTEIGEALFVEASGRLKTMDFDRTRLNAFYNLYGFCRNISFACLVAALAILVLGHWHAGLGHKVQWVVVAAFVSIGMLYRYLKFYRHFAYEVFTTYATASTKN